MIFSLDLRRARKGDCFLLHYGTKSRPGLMVVDGGPSQVYQPQLKPRLAAVRTARGLRATASLPVDGVMVSHIDDDHINGILELTGELVEAREARRPLPVKIRAFWYNAFDDIIGNSPAELLTSVSAAFGEASLAGSPDGEGLNPDAARVLASVNQGIRLRDDARKLRLRINPAFAGALVMATKETRPLNLGKGLSFTVAGPMKAELLALQKSYDTFLKQEAKKTRKVLAAFTDTSVPNLSSIVVLAAAGGKTMLLTGDARGDKILEGLELVGALQPAGTLHVDILKMPHHGSDRNMALSFLRRVTADHYIFSGDGQYGNPERATLEMLDRARGDKAAYRIHLTYPVDEIDADRERDWKIEQEKERAAKKRKPRTKVRADWSAAGNGLAGLLATRPALAKRVSIVPADAPHVIDLLEPLGF